jgi:hypothetical protein
VYECVHVHLLSPLLYMLHSQSARGSSTIRSRSTFSLPFLLTASRVYVPLSDVWAWCMIRVVVEPPWYSSVITVHSLELDMTPESGCTQVKTGGGSKNERNGIITLDEIGN